MAQAPSTASTTTQQQPSSDKPDSKQQDVKEIIIRKPDDFHLHLRDGPSLPLLVPHTSLVNQTKN